jgi:putative SOS response-associated peptidase YedK
MCGRAFLEISEPDWKRRYGSYFSQEAAREPVPQASPDFRPTQTTTVILQAPVGQAGARAAAISLPWGWHVRVGEHQKLLINARSETIGAKPLFRRAFDSHRCVMPASGFIEWKREATHKTPHRISLAKGGILSIAGLWRTEGFLLLTREADAEIGRIHDRMPILLDEEQEKLWLSDTRDLALLRRECLEPRLHDFRIEATELPSSARRKPKPESPQISLF